MFSMGGAWRKTVVNIVEPMKIIWKGEEECYGDLLRVYTTLRRRRAPVNRTGGGAGRGLPPIPTSLVAADSYMA